MPVWGTEKWLSVPEKRALERYDDRQQWAAVEKRIHAVIAPKPVGVQALQAIDAEAADVYRVTK